MYFSHQCIRKVICRKALFHSKTVTNRPHGKLAQTSREGKNAHFWVPLLQRSRSAAKLQKCCSVAGLFTGYISKSEEGWQKGCLYLMGDHHLMENFISVLFKEYLHLTIVLLIQTICKFQGLLYSNFTINLGATSTTPSFALTLQPRQIICLENRELQKKTEGKMLQEIIQSLGCLTTTETLNNI